ncbi:hypothetical protein AMECASPLE_030047 [Ameca splendens]|uniref:Myb/SANT-like DNA-binding domain-containing protein n=1 Tax=Ameca splendens TaxID=208324 RepID=A0ABV0Y6G0_9TELE
MALQREKIHNWQENEIKQLLVIRGTEAIRSQIRGTVKDSVVYSRISKLLAERGVYSKLKSLRKHYLRIREQKACCGNERVHWLFYELRHRAFPDGEPRKTARKADASPQLWRIKHRHCPRQRLHLHLSRQPQKASRTNRRLWLPSGTKWMTEINKHLGQVVTEDEESPFSPPDPLQNNNTTFSVPF